MALSTSLGQRYAIAATAATTLAPPPHPLTSVSFLTLCLMTQTSIHPAAQPVMAHSPSVFHNSLMYFVRSGIIYLRYASLWRANNDGRLWSSTPHLITAETTYNLGFTPIDILPSNQSDRWAGFSLRFHHSPMYFVRSGSIHIPSGELLAPAGPIYYWGSTAYPTNIQTASGLGVYAQGNTLASYNTYRYYGFSLQSTYLHISPTYFVRSGYNTLQVGTLQKAGLNSYIWTSTTFPNSHYTYDLSFGPGTISPSNTYYYIYNRYNGFSLHSIKHKISLISLLCISSVVAVSIFHSVRSAVAATADSSGHPPLIQPIFTALSTSPSAPSALPLHTTSYAPITAYPSAYHHYSPLYFVRSGYIGLVSGSLWGAGFTNYYWLITSVPLITRQAFSSYFTPIDIYPSHNSNRANGFPLHTLIFITLSCISSVVAISILNSAQSEVQTALIIFGHLPPNPSTTISHSASPSILQTPTPQVATIATPASPSNMYILYEQRMNIVHTLFIQNYKIYTPVIE